MDIGLLSVFGQVLATAGNRRIKNDCNGKQVLGIENVGLYNLAACVHVLLIMNLRKEWRQAGVPTRIVNCSNF